MAVSMRSRSEAIDAVFRVWVEMRVIGTEGVGSGGGENENTRSFESFPVAAVPAMESAVESTGGDRSGAHVQRNSMLRRLQRNDSW